MRFTIKNPQITPAQLMQQAGYIPHPSPEKGGDSYIKRLQGDWYPRFHVYCYPIEGGGFDVDLHLDWRRPLHKKYANSSEQDTPIVREETLRVHTIAVEMVARYKNM